MQAHWRKIVGPVFFPVSRLVLTALARAVIRMLNAAEIRYWADYGTLLGLVRDGGVIYGDTDVDVSVIEDADTLAKLDACARRRHLWFVLAKDPSRRSYTCRMRGLPANCDIYVHRAEPSGTQLKGCEGPYSDLPAALVRELTVYDWRGLAVSVPRDAERFLAFRYGDDFRVKRAGHRGRLHSTYHPSTPSEAKLRYTDIEW
jgi:LicD family